MDAVTIFLFAGMALALWWAFSRTPDAEAPLLAQSDPMPLGIGRLLTALLLLSLVVLGMGLMGAALPGSAYATVEATGDADLTSAFAFACLLVVLGGLMAINGIARGLGVLLIVLGILASVGITEMVR
ncbi:MAG TPA: hypothetical protein DCL15_11630 [Chloroflexi bacterium]|nr:hypothetical protein [Chloroflexota bacterium]HHW84964.1 hypothetical protein [Chloroflexota bacterium]